MTMNSSNEFDAKRVDLSLVAAARLAYIKPMAVAEARALGLVPEGIKLPKDITLYAIHAADGTRLAVMDNREAAYGAAMENELVPVSVH
jgi:hypothetical protein